MSLSRADRSLLTDWWFTIDRALIVAVVLLGAIGLVVSLAASPAIAAKKELDPFYFVERQVLFAVAGLATMLAVSLLDATTLRRLALLVFLGAVVAMLAALFVGPEINGAHRWLRIGGFSIQPSEFAKPAFVVLTAWALAERHRRPDMPALVVVAVLFAMIVVPLRLAPDLGQALLVAAVWAALLVLAGLPLLWPAALAALGGVVVAIAYLSGGYIRERIDAFLWSDPVATSQAGRAIQSFVDGGYFGVGPGAGTIKTALPDAHTDFIFAVIAEEYGALACLGIVMLYAFIVLRVFWIALRHRDLACRYALFGLGLLFGAQALVHMAVNVGLAPTTGMTLPLISAGGSSMLAIALTLGTALALARGASRPRRMSMAAMAGHQTPPPEPGGRLG